MKKLILLLVVLCFAATVAPAIAQHLADSQADFTAIYGPPPSGQGTNNWNYMIYKPNASAANWSTAELEDGVRTWDDADVPWWFPTSEGNSILTIGATVMAGQTYWTWSPCRRWTSTAAGNITISGQFWKTSTTCVYPKRFTININGVNQYGLLLATDDAARHDYSVAANVKVGDKIDFVYDCAVGGIGAFESDADNVKGYMTAVIDAAVNVPLNVNVTLEDYHGDFDLLPIKAVLKQGSTTVATQIVTPAGPTTSIQFQNLSTGSYTVQVRAAKFLSKTASATVGSTGGSVDISLPNGDLDGDGTVTSTDVSNVIKNIDKTGN